MLLDYNSPFVIFGAVSLMIYFVKMRLKSIKIINWIAISSFAVYLLHSQQELRKVFIDIVDCIYIKYNGILCFSMMFLFLVIVFVLAVFIDKFRIYTFNLFYNKFFK